jgi:glutamate dehydrogenase/leucine dehydrogenase
MTGLAADTDLRAQVFDLLGDEYEQIVYFHDPDVGLRAIVAIHSTVLGPAMGGTRCRPYVTETEGLVDVLRLARGMTYKQSVAGIDYGGGKAVIFGDPATVRTEPLLRSYGRFLHRLGGTYLTAEDVGTTQSDMDLIREETPYVTGTSLHLGGSGDPSPATAWGVLHAHHAVATHVWGARSLDGRHVVVSGVGKVGRALVHHLHDAGARVTVADVRAEAIAPLVDDLGVAVVSPDEAHRVECDIWAPCAFGAVLSRDTVPELRCAAVCGAANNQLAGDGDDERIAEREVLYVPDYVANAGGVINISEEPAGYDVDRAMRHVAQIEQTVTRVVERAGSAGITTAAAADRLAEERLAAGRQAAAERARSAARD